MGLSAITFSHVTQFYVKKGYPKKKLHSPLLKAVMQGVKRCMPPKADSRAAFLIHYHIPRLLLRSRSGTTKKATAALSFGFFRYATFHSYGKFSRENLTLVVKGGRELSPKEFSNKLVLRLLVSNCIVGFYFTFNDKFHPRARAYLCRVGDIHRRLNLICPLRHLVTLMQSPTDEMFYLRLKITVAV